MGSTTDAIKKKERRRRSLGGPRNRTLFNPGKAVKKRTKNNGEEKKTCGASV